LKDALNALKWIIKLNMKNAPQHFFLNKSSEKKFQQDFFGGGVKIKKINILLLYFVFQVE
jgi:hypothetical protein